MTKKNTPAKISYRPNGGDMPRFQLYSWSQDMSMSAVFRVIQCTLPEGYVIRNIVSVESSLPKVGVVKNSQLVAVVTQMRDKQVVHFSITMYESVKSDLYKILTECMLSPQIGWDPDITDVISEVLICDERNDILV